LTRIVVPPHFADLRSYSGRDHQSNATERLERFNDVTK
jgi:hypothetical protein